MNTKAVHVVDTIERWTGKELKPETRRYLCLVVRAALEATDERPRIESLEGPGPGRQVRMWRAFHGAGLPCPRDVARLVQILPALKMYDPTPRSRPGRRPTVVGSLHDAAVATGWPDPFTLSYVCLRMVGMRPRQARELTTKEVLLRGLEIAK